MVENGLGDLKVASETDVATASRKPATAKVPKPAEVPAETPKPAAETTPVPAPAAEAPPSPAPKKEDAPVVEPPKSPVEKIKAKAKKAETFIKKDAPVVEAAPNEFPEAVKLEIEKYKTQASEAQKNAEKLLSDPDIQILLEAKKSNKDIFAVLDEVKGVDPKTIPLEDLHKMDLQEDGLSPDEIESELEEFRELSPAKQKIATNERRKKLEAQSANKKQNFLSALKTDNEMSDVERSAAAKLQEELATKTKTEFTKLCDDYVGKNHYGLTGTPQMAESLKNILQNPNGLIGKNQDGSLNASELFELAHFKLYKDLLFEELKNSAYAEAYEELEKDFAATGSNVPQVRMPQGADKLTAHEQGKALLGSATLVR